VTSAASAPIYFALFCEVSRRLLRESRRMDFYEPKSPRVAAIAAVRKIVMAVRVTAMTKSFNRTR
jgi:hypothetical protein